MLFGFLVFLAGLIAVYLAVENMTPREAVDAVLGADR